MSTGEAQAGFGVFFGDEVFELLFGEETVVYGIVDLIAYDEVKLPRGRSLKCGEIGVFGRLFVLLRSDVASAEVACVVKTFAAFVKQQLVTVHRQNIAYKRVLAHAPIFDELYVGYLPAVTERAAHQPQRGRGLALPVAGIHHNYRLLRLKILKSHT